MSLLLGFNPDEVEESPIEFQPDPLLPEGRHQVMLVDISEGSGEKGPWIKFKYSIMEGENNGKTITIFENPKRSEQSKTIFDSRMKSLCKAVGIIKVESYDDLLHKPILINIKHWHRDDGPVNQINYFVPVSAQQPKSNVPQPFVSYDEPPPF